MDNKKEASRESVPSVQVDIELYIYIYIYIYILPTPPHGQDMKQGQFLSGV